MFQPRAGCEVYQTGKSVGNSITSFMELGQLVRVSVSIGCEFFDVQLKS